jgi:uncharacterized repeat protein (TIGR03803 family)
MRRNNALTGESIVHPGRTKSRKIMKTKLKLCMFIIFALAAALRLEAQGTGTILDFLIFDAPNLNSLGNGANFGDPKSPVPGGRAVPAGAKPAASGGGGVTFGAVCGGGGNGFGGICTLTANSDGSFSTSSLFVFPDASGGLYGTALAAGDANGDGLPDTIAVTTSVGGNNFSGTLTEMNTDGSNPQSVSFPACPNGVGASSVCIDASQTVTVTGQSGPGPNGSILFFPGGLGSCNAPVEVDCTIPGGYYPRQLIPGPGVLPASVHKAGAKANAVTLIPLYGVMFFGGTNGAGPGTGGYGTVYTVNNDGTGFQTLHVFSSQRGTNGYGPAGGLVLSGNTLYGTTSGGGKFGSGTLFKIDTSGSNFMVLKSFSAWGTEDVNGYYNYTNADGMAPEGTLFLSGNTLYGTTLEGGTNGGGGTVFSINTNGNNFTLLHSFTSPSDNGTGVFTNSDGGGTRAGVVLSGYNLFGTTPYGGTNGSGTMFVVVLPSPPSLNIKPAAGNFAVSWPSAAANFMLQSNLTLNPLTWSNFSGSINDDGTNKSVSVMPTAGSAYFRLLNTNGP